MFDTESDGSVATATATAMLTSTVPVTVSRRDACTASVNDATITETSTPTSSGESSSSDCTTKPTETPPTATSGKVRRTSRQAIVATAYAARAPGEEGEPEMISATAMRDYQFCGQYYRYRRVTRIPPSGQTPLYLAVGTLLLCAVGLLQFEVVAQRLRHEFGCEARI